jgi:DNA-binding response OmpR family regulator
VARVLVVEDSDLAFALQSNLALEGYETAVAVTGARGLEMARAWRPDAIVLDLSLPELDGLQVLRSLRLEQSDVMVLVLTARARESDKVMALKLGADDYLTKPFGLLELLARVEALLRRTRRGELQPKPLITFGDVTLDESRRVVSRSDSQIALTPKEFDLLLALARAPGVVSRAELLRRVWGYSPLATTRTLDTHVAELRRKLEADPRRPRLIVTVRKVGYRLNR